MATINGKSNHVQQGTWRSVWPLLGNADSGTPDQLSRYARHSVQFGATDPLTGVAGVDFGGATAVLEGSDDGVTYFTMKDAYGNNISTSSAARFDFINVPLHTRPRTSGGNETELTVIIISHPES